MYEPEYNEANENVHKIAPKNYRELAVQDLKKLIQFWIDDHAHCIECGYVYQSVEDFLRCDPYSGHSEDLSFVCGSCYPEYCKKHPLLNGQYYRGKPT